jgi:hypothetical protein
LAAPVDIRSTIEYRVASYFAEHFPHRRVMPTGSCALWMNAFNDVPQLSGGHDPTAPNWLQRVAVFTIYSGMNAGARDVATSILWLQAFGVHAISVHGPGSLEYWKPFARPGKFEGALPVLWRDGADAIYAVPQRSPNLSHIIPVAALVTRRPVDGLDVAPVENYVAAIESPAMPLTEETMMDVGHLRIRGVVGEGQAISVQMNYVSGWRATVAGAEAPVTSDALGFLVVRPVCPSGCVVDLRFEGGMEARVARAVSVCVWGVAVGWLVAGWRRRVRV